MPYQILVVWVDVSTFQSGATLIVAPEVSTFSEADKLLTETRANCDDMVREGYMLSYSILDY